VGSSPTSGLSFFAGASVPAVDLVGVVVVMMRVGSVNEFLPIPLVFPPDTHDPGIYFYIFSV
jgi:hypothetical protein